MRRPGTHLDVCHGYAAVLELLDAEERLRELLVLSWSTQARGGRASGTAQPCAGKGARARLAQRPGSRAGAERNRVERLSWAARPISRDAPLPRPRRLRPRRPRPARSGRSSGRTAGWWASATASPRAAARGRPAPPWLETGRAGSKRVRRDGNARTTLARARGVIAATGCREKKSSEKHARRTAVRRLRGAPTIPGGYEYRHTVPTVPTRRTKKRTKKTYDLTWSASAP